MTATNDDDDWQSLKDTLQSKAAYVLQKSLMCDIHFIVGKDASKQKISAHKIFLGMSSSVFAKMFTSSFPIPNDEIQVPDISPGAFHAILNYIYTDKVEITEDIVMNMIYAAKKYGLSKLELLCEDFLLKNVTTDNACSLLSQAKFFDYQRLMTLCFAQIDGNAIESFASDDFLKLDLDLLCSIFARSSLEMAEKDVFQAAIRWSVAECERKELPCDPTNQRAVLGKALSLIRFPIMSQADFAGGPAKSSVLTKDECVDVFLYFAASTKPQINFPTSRRKSGLLAVYRVTGNNFKYWEEEPGYKRIIEAFRFSANSRISLKGFSILTRGDFWSTVHSSNIKVSDATGMIFEERRTGTISPFSTSETTHRIMLTKEVEISAHTKYNVTIELMGTRGVFCYCSCGTSKGVDKVGGGEVTFNFFDPTRSQIGNKQRPYSFYVVNSVAKGILWGLLYSIPI